MSHSSLSSPLYEHLLAAAADDVEAGGPCWAVLEGREDDPRGSVLALRFLGAVHRLVLTGRAPDLARYYPSAGGTFDDDPWPAFRAAVGAHVDELRDDVRQGVQTNEVGRSAALLGGFHLIAARWGLPLRLLEPGSSAGLNLRWDRYRYEAGEWAWGDPSSPVRFVDVYPDGVPETVPVEIAERRGCDRAPIELTDDGALLLTSFVWPDHDHRFRLLRAAIDVASAHPVDVETAHAVTWIRDRLAESHPGVATVVFHSIFMQYMSREDRQALVDTITARGAEATQDEPLAWLRMEPPGDLASVRLTVWPDGEERVIAESGYHGRPVYWRG
jgi:hypothetical protein